MGGFCSMCAIDTMGGLYADPHYYRGSGLAGTIMIADGSAEGKIAAVGTDDGVAFWAIRGAIVDRAAGIFTMDFSPKGGPAELSGRYEKAEGAIAWADKSRWTALSEAPTTAGRKSGAPGRAGGLYFDPSFASEHGGIKGLRFVAADADGKGISFVGTDDGLNFWACRGSFDAEQKGQVSADFSSRGLEFVDNTTGFFSEDKFTWDNGSKWDRA